MHPFLMFDSLRFHRALLWELIKRDIAIKYKGSHLGMLWALLAPLAMLSIYSCVFGTVFKSRWTASETADVPYPLILFAGLIVFNFLSECVNRAPTLVTSSANLVKKTVFPIAIMPWVAVVSAAVNASISTAILLAGELLFIGHVPPTFWLFPVVLLPVAFVALGAGWFLSALGVYVRDIAQVVGLAMTGLLFLSPIFYPLPSAPGILQSLSRINPLATQVQAMREVLLWGQFPDLQSFVISLLAGLLVAWLGLVWFSKTSDGFADVL